VLTVLLFASPYAMRVGAHGRPMLGIAMSLFVLWAFTRLDMGSYYRPSDVRNYPVVRIVQPSVPQREKWRPENQRRIFDDHLDMSDVSRPATTTIPADTLYKDNRISLIVWSEAAMPFLPLNEPVALADIGRLLPPNTTLASGALRADPPVAPGDRRRVYNSLILFGGGETAEIMATYDKTHLVPFGEYLPLQGLFEAIGLQQLSRMRGGFASGPEPRPLIDVSCRSDTRAPTGVPECDK
jgi:apolipoprotein N-acyltransferase